MMTSIWDNLSFGDQGGLSGLLDGLPPWMREPPAAGGIPAWYQALKGGMDNGQGAGIPVPGKFPMSGYPTGSPVAPQGQPQPQGTPMPPMRPPQMAQQPPQPMPQQAPQMPPGGLPPRTPFGQAPKVDGVGPRLYEALGGFLGNEGIIGGAAAGIKTLATGEVTNPYALAKHQQMQTYASLIRDFGASPSAARMVMQNPEVMKAFIPSIVPKYDKFDKGPLYGRFNAATGRTDVQGAAPEFTKLGPGDTGVYTTAPFGGRPGGSTQVATGGPEKPPEHYTWIDPSNPSKGAVRIPGTEPPMSKDEAGMVAMLEASKHGVAQARDYFLGPDFKGDFKKPLSLLNAPLSAGAQALGVGDTDRHRRSIEMGAEAALRMATGANAPPPEVGRYANFYMPSVYDTDATRQQKLDALQRFTKYAEANMKAGRLVAIKDLPGPEKFMQGGSAAGPVNSRPQNSAWPPPPPGFQMMGQ